MHGGYRCANYEKMEGGMLEDLLGRENALLSADEDNPGSMSVGGDGSISEESVEGIICLCGVLKRQHERVREALSLFGTIGAGEAR